MASGVCQIKEDFNEINDDFRALGGGIDTSPFKPGHHLYREELKPESQFNEG